MKRSYSSLINPSPPPSSSSCKHQTKYDVFLSFRGEDTRKNFTSHLYAALCQKGIYTFLDDDKLERGKSIAPELLEAIEDSRCSIIVISENYASSTWCLDELVKIVECMKDHHAQIVLPIFYQVDPSHVRKQIGSFGEAFHRHEQVFSHSLEKVKAWRDALKLVGNLAGWHLHDRDEAKFIQDFIIELSTKLDIQQLNISKDLFGMDSRLEKLNRCVCASSLNNVSFIGICGMGGIGKTTLARAYYEWMCCKFEGSSFISNVREVSVKKESGLEYLQSLLLSDILNADYTRISDVYRGVNMIRNRLGHKKVLVVLDDVDKLEQLRVLAGKDIWFGFGSRIIITTRDESLLNMYNDCVIYRVKPLNESESLQLFSWKAFKSNDPLKDYAELSKQVIEYANGLPLALEVLGSFLCGKRINEWKSALDRLKKYPNKEIVKVLQITFDGLEETEKSIFLDIACFFNWLHKDYVLHIMESCGFFPEIGIRVLIDKSLLHLSNDNKLWMHDLLEEMGMEIVQEKSRNEPGGRSRIWDIEDICHVFENNTGMEEVEAIVCYFPIESKKLSCKAFLNMKKLRLLILCNVWLFDGGFTPDLEHLSNELCLLEWEKFPSNCFPSSFHPDGLVELKLRWNNMEQLWNKPIKPLYNLKIIDLENSLNLRKFEDFEAVPNLEKLILEGCKQLQEIHLSVASLKRLTLLNLKYCSGLEHLPTSIGGLRSLKVLELNGCQRLLNLPEDLGHLNSLEELNLTDTTVPVLSSSILLPKNLETLSCSGVGLSGEGKNIVSIIIEKGHLSAGFSSLKKLDLSRCNLWEGEIPEGFGCLGSLEDLDLSFNYFCCLPASFNKLSKLKILHLRFCKNLKHLGPELPPSLEIVRVDSCTSLESFLDPLDDWCNLRCSAWCLDCFELVRRQGSKRTAFASLKRYLQNLPNPSKRFDIVLPGNEIPFWFTHRSSESLISFQLSSNWCNSKWRGFALSVCFVTNIDTYFYCDIRINGQDWGFGRIKFCLSRVSSLEHHWLSYLPRDMYLCEEWQNNNNGVIEFSFKSCNSRVLFGACGVRLVHEQDIAYLNSNTVDCIDFPDSAKLTDERLTI